MVPFLCDFMREAVILSDGRVTTCCMDPLAQNCFANIYEDSFEEVSRRYLENIRRIADDVYALPRCRVCYDKIKAAGFPRTGSYKVDFSEEEKQRFLDEHSSLSALVIEPSAICNLKCRGCMQSRYDIPGHRQAKYLDMERMRAFIGDHARDIKVIRLYNYGETFVNKGAIPFIRSFKEASPETNISIATNGLLLKGREMLTALVRSGVDRLVFSIHGSSQESIEPYMTKVFNFDRLLETLRLLVEIRTAEQRTTPVLAWKYLLFEWNDSEQDVQRAVRLAEEVGMDGIQFVVPGYPSPSPRFKDAPEEVLRLNRKFRQGVDAR